MSRKTIVIDDHAGTPIDDAQASDTQTCITVTRGAQGSVVIWDALNLTDESWDELVKTLREFCPETEPDMSAEAHVAHVTSNERIRLMEADAAATAQAQALEAEAAAEAAAKVPAAAATPAAKVPAPVRGDVPSAAKASTVKLSQGEARKRSAAVRSWWQSLSPQALTALGLPAAKSGPGKMPVAVYDAYNAAHSS